MVQWLQTQGVGFGAGYELVKALHLIAIVFWIAGLLMLPRLFVYHHQSQPGSDGETIFIAGEKRLLTLILNPAMVIAWLAGLAMLVLNWPLLTNGWIHTKLLLVLGLSGYHGFLSATARKFATNQRPFTEKTWRLLNEIPAVTAILVIVLAIVKPF